MNVILYHSLNMNDTIMNVNECLCLYHLYGFNQHDKKAVL